MVDLNLLNSAQYQQALGASQSQTQSFNQAVGSLSANLGPLGRAFSLVTAPVAFLTKGLGGYGQAAQEVQDRTLPLKATAAVTGQSFQALANDAETLARKLPITSNAAAQTVIQVQSLGITGQGSEARIGKLATTVTKLSAAVGESAGVITPALANVQRAFGDENLDPTRVQKMADVVTTLTDKVGGSASSILSFAANIGPFARQAGVGEAATLGISAAFSKLGDDGTSAATAVNRVLSDVNKSIRDGGGNISVYASLLGKTNSQFIQLAKNNPTQTLEQVLNSLGSGPQGARALESLGLDSVRTQTALTALGQSGGLQGAISTAVGAQGDGATDKAARAAFSGLSNELQHLQNESEQVSEQFGGPVLTALGLFAKGLSAPLGLFNAISRNPIVGKLTELATGIGLVAASLKIFTTGLAAARIVRGSSTLAAGRGAALVGSADGNAGTALAEARLRASETSALGLPTRAARVGQRDVRAIQIYQNARAYEADPEQYRLAQDTSRELGLRDPQGRLYSSTVRAPQGVLTRGNSLFGGFRERTAQVATLQAADAATRINPVRFAAAAGVEGYRGVRFLAASPFRLAATMNPGERSTVDSATGTYRDFIDKLKEARSATDSETGATKSQTEQVQAVNAVLREFAVELQTTRGTLRGGLAGVVGGATTGFRARATVVGQSIKGLAQDEEGNLSGAALGGRIASGAGRIASAGSSALSLVGGPIGLALLAGGAGFSEYRSESSQRDQANQDFLNTSISAGLDKYRDALGLAVTQTKTFADTIASAGKTARTQATTIGAATDTGINAVTAAQALTSPVLTKFNAKSSDADIAAQINALSINGFGSDPASLGAIRDDLVRQVDPNRAANILAQVNTSAAPAVVATGQNVDAAGIARTASTGSALGVVGKGLQAISFGQLENTKGGRNLADSSKQAINSALAAIQTQYEQQSKALSPQYAQQQRLLAFSQLGSSAGGSEDEFNYVGTKVAQALGADPKYQVAISHVDNRPSDLLGYLAKNNSTVATAVAGFNPNANIAAVPVLNAYGSVAQQAGLRGSAAAAFDNTKGGQTQTDVLASLLQPGDLQKQTTAVSEFIAGLSKSGSSLADITGKAGALVTTIDDATNEQSQFAAAVQATVSAAQSAQSIGQNPGATLATQIGTTQQQLANANLSTTSGVQAFQAARTDSTGEGAQLASQLEDRLQAEYNYNKSLTRADADYQLARRQAEFDTNLAITRSRADFATQIERSSEQAATAAYAPFQRIQIQATTDGRTLIANLKQQNEALTTQANNLAALRKQGVTNQTIQQLGLSDASQAQEVSTLVADGRFDKGQAKGLNAAVNQRLPAAKTLFTDPGNLQLQQQTKDFNLQLTRQEDDQTRSFARQDLARSTEKARQLQDLQDSYKSFSGNYLDLQNLYNKGLEASQKDFAAQMGDSLKIALANQKQIDALNSNNSAFAAGQTPASVGSAITGAAPVPATSTPGALNPDAAIGGQNGKGANDPNVTAAIKDLVNNFQFTGRLLTKYTPQQIIRLQGDLDAAKQDKRAVLNPQNTALPALNSATANAIDIVAQALVPDYAYGGVAMREHVGRVAERGVPEAMIPLDLRGTTMMARAMETYLGRSLAGMNTTGAARTYVTDNSSYSYDQSTKVMGPITVKATSPNELGSALKAKQRSQNLTAAPVGR